MNLFRELDNIKEAPTTFESVHESIFRSYMILQTVRKLIEANLSKEEILSFIIDSLDLEQKDANPDDYKSRY